MNLWIDMVRPGLLALAYALAFLLPSWALYRLLVLRGWLRRFHHSIRLLLVVVAGNIFLFTGGRDALLVLETLLRGPIPLDADGAPESALVSIALVLLIIATGLFIAQLLDAIIFETRLREWEGGEPPRLLRDALKLVVLAVTLGYILAGVFSVSISVLGGGAAVLTLVLGLALQNVLGDLFSGVVLQIERPFAYGDWIQIGEQEGEVVEFNWRATRLNTRGNVGVVIPNSLVAKTEIRNLNLNTPFAAVDRYVGTEYKEPPNRIKAAILEAMLQSADVVQQPPPQVWTHEYGDSAIIYRLRFWVRDFRRMPEISDEVMTNVWYAFKRHDITIPWPIRNVYMREEERTTVEEQTDTVHDLLRQVDLLTPLSGAQLRALAEKLTPVFFGRGEVLIRQGDEGDSFYIIQQGRVQVSVAGEVGGVEMPVAVLASRDFFGEMSLLAGDRRTATVRALEDTRVIIIDKDDFAGIIQDNPTIAAEMATIYYRRTEELSETRLRAEQRQMPAEGEEGGERALLRRIQRFFGL
ncbi:cyclic nucleotide-binding domain-containing protein [Gemmatimonadota bacterium]